MGKLFVYINTGLMKSINFRVQLDESNRIWICRQKILGVSFDNEENTEIADKQLVNITVPSEVLSRQNIFSSTKCSSQQFQTHNDFE